MPHLETFNFDIITENVPIHEKYCPSSSDICRTFIEKQYRVDCYIDCFPNKESRCHVYSLPYTMDRLLTISSNFPGGLFSTVRRLMIYDARRPFEHHFFLRLSRSFPFLNFLSVQNDIEQLDQQEQTSAIVEFSYLTILNFGDVHIDYLEEFFVDSNISVSYVKQMYIKYKDLVTITDNFTRNETRAIASKIKRIIFNEGEIVCSKGFYSYFPLL